MAASLVVSSLANNTVIQALFDSLLERLMNRVSKEIPSAIEASIKKYAMDKDAAEQRAMAKYHALLLDEVKQQKSNSSANSNDNLLFCNSVLKLVDERLKGLELLTMADLNVALSHLGDAKHALSRGNEERFRFFVEESYLKSREALYKMGGRLLYKIYVYSLLCFDGFFIFSDWGKDLRGGLYFIRKLLLEMQCDEELNSKLNKALNSWRWNSFEKTLIAHCVLFGVKICGLVRAVESRIDDHHQKISSLKSQTQSAKGLKSLFSQIERNCTVLKHTDDEKESHSLNVDDDILNLEQWIPNIWKGHFFGICDHRKNIEISAKHYLQLFQLSESVLKEDHSSDLWLCPSTQSIFEYKSDRKMWLAVSDALCFDYYFHHRIDAVDRIKPTFNAKAFDDHFSPFCINHRLILRKKWAAIHPKLRLLLRDCLCAEDCAIWTLDLSFNDVRFGLAGAKFISNVLNSKQCGIRSLKIAKNGLDFQCIQLITISLLSIENRSFSSLTELNISHNAQLGDDALHLLLNKGIAAKCPRMQTLYAQWTSITDFSCKYIVAFFQQNPYHALTALYLNGCKGITSNGAVLINALLQGILMERKKVSVNLSDCSINISRLVKFDKRLIVQ